MLVAVPPGDIEPQFKFPIGLVQALLEYTCKPAEDEEGEISILELESLGLESLELEVEVEEPVEVEVEEPVEAELTPLVAIDELVPA